MTTAAGTVAGSERDRSARDPLPKILALDEFHDEGAYSGDFLDARMYATFGQLSDAWGASRVNRASHSVSLANESGKTWSLTSRLRFVSRAR